MMHRSFNRTFMELKQYTCYIEQQDNVSFNRTFMELKQYIKNLSKDEKTLF